MYNKKVLLGIGFLLICLGLIKPYLGNLNRVPSPTVSVDVEKPSDPSLLNLSQELITIIKDSGVTREDGLRLAGLSYDIGTLISLDGPSEVIKNTEEIRQANRLSGMMLRMDMNKKYPNLASGMNALVTKYIGDDIVSLNSELRLKASDAFRALAWSFLEGTK